MESNFIKKINKLADEFAMFPDEGLIIVAVSGGADSMCMLDVLIEISSKRETHAERSFEVAAAHFNHKLRDDESDLDEAFVINECKHRGIKLYKDSADVRAYAVEKKLGLVEAARELRYDFLAKTAQEISSRKKNQAVRIATAHNADDLAETLIINLVRGAGASGLSGIPPKRDSIIRPMLHISRDEIMEYINLKGVKFVEDSTNSLQNQARNKIRHSIIPLFREMNPQFTEAAVKTAELSRIDEEYLSKLAKEYADSESLTAENISLMPFSLASRVIRQMSGSRLSHQHVAAVLDLCKAKNSSKFITLPGMIVRREYDKILFGNNSLAKEYSTLSLNPIILKAGSVVPIPETSLEVSCSLMTYENQEDVPSNKTFNTFLFHVEQICGIMTIRSRRDGDSIKLFGSNCTKKLKKLFNEHRVPVEKRELVPVIFDDKGVLGVYGLCRSNRALPILGEQVLKVEFTPQRAGIKHRK